MNIIVDFWKMIFKNFSRVVHADRNDRTACFCGDFKSAVFKRKKGKLRSCVARPFGKDAD